MISLDVELKSKKWLEQKNIENFVKKTCLKIIPLTDLQKILNKKIQLELFISLVSDAQMKKINFKFRSKNKPTNVLSFPFYDENLIRKDGLLKAFSKEKIIFLGDIILSYETIKKESLAQKKKINDHLTHLILHAILHLIGFDHEEEKMAKIMESLEIKILNQLGIKNPYQN